MSNKEKLRIEVTKRITDKNDTFAEKNRIILKNSKTLSINLISSPGSGKTTLLEKTISSLLPKYNSSVIVGDLRTARDAKRLEKDSLEVTQINTGFSCHLYANQVTKSLETLDLNKADFLFIENVGNMVCPGEFDLGENLKVILYSLPEGDDKIAKYPTIFQAADLVLMTKIDLIDVLTFDKNKALKDLRKINNSVPVIELSSQRGDGMDAWMEWLELNYKKSIGNIAKSIKAD